MENKTTKTNIKKEGSKKRKLILIGAIASLGVIILSIGLGVGLTQNNNSNSEPETPAIPEVPVKPEVPVVPEVVRNNYQLIEKGEGDTKEVIVRLNEKTTFDQIKTEVEQIKKDLTDNTITELRLPYGTRREFQTTPDADGNTKLDLEKIKNELGIEIEESKVGYVFYPSDETNENITYQKQNLFEVVLPKTQKTIVNNKFRENKIRKVNFEDLNNLESIKLNSFYNNKIESIDFSNAISLKLIDIAAFQNNLITGTLKIPPKLERVGNSSFKNNKIEHLDLTNAKSLNLFHDECFNGNNIEELDLSLLPKLKRINIQAFFDNNIKTLNLKSNTLSYIGQQAFSNNKDKETGKLYDLIPEGYIFPNVKSYRLWIQVFNRDPSIKGTKTLFVNKTTSIENSFSYPTNIYKAELDLSILKYKVELIDGKNTLTFDDDTTIGDVILRQDLIKAENAKRKIDKFVFPIASITKFGDGEEFSKTSERLNGLKQYLGLSQAVDIWTSVIEGTNWRVFKEVDNSDTSKQIKVLKISDNITGDENSLTEINKELTSKGIDVTTINEIHFPFRLKLAFEEDKIRELLKIKTLTNDDIGYVLNKNDYNENLANSSSNSGRYQNEKIVELNLPKEIQNIPNYVFKNNRIRKINWKELVNLETIGVEAFMNNKLKSLVFTKDSPPKLKKIGTRAFKNNDGELLTKDTELPTTLEVIGDDAIKVKDGISITTRKLSSEDDIRPDSFEGEVTFKEYT